MGLSQEARDALFKGSDSRSNFKQVIAKRSDLVRFARGRMVPAGAGLTVVHEAGEVLGFASSGPDSGFYKPYDDSATDGSQTAVGVLAESILVDEFGDGSEIAVIKEGDLFKDLLIGLDAAAIVDMSGKSYVEGGVNLISIRA